MTGMPPAAGGSCAASQPQGERNAAAAAAAWRFESQLRWPGARGRRLLDLVSSEAGDSSPFDLELCVPTAGHLALVLVRRCGSQAADDSAVSSSAPALPPGLPRHSSTPVVPSAAQLSAPRVIYVVDAVPPRRSPPATRPEDPQWSLLSKRAHSFGGVTSADSAAQYARHVLSPTEADDVELVEELFATTKVGKDASVLAKAPLLCARFDSRVIAVRFTRDDAARPPPPPSSSSSSSSPPASSSSDSKSPAPSASPLRCVVAREDGMCYIWEWGADLFQWTFLNRFCFLENPNLKWTRPVLAFTTISSRGDGALASDVAETTELAWWSAENKDAPRLWLRKIQYALDRNTFRTEIRVGSAFELPGVGQLLALESSRLGLWVVTRLHGVWFRGTGVLGTAKLSWRELSGADGEPDVDVLSCVHNVTGELLLLLPRALPGDAAAGLYVVSPERSSARGVRSRELFAIPDVARVERMAAHRQLLVLLREDESCVVCSLVTGERLVCLADPTTAWATRPATLELWTTTGRASAVGLWASHGFWELVTPAATAIAASLRRESVTSHPAQRALDALRSVKPYGASLQYDAVRFALEVLDAARSSVALAEAPSSADAQAMRLQAWQTAVQSISSPALLFSTLSPEETTPASLVDELARLVEAVYRVTHDVIVTGRLGATMDRREPATLKGLRHLTPANVEALHHLANWVLLAKRKLVRLQTTVYHKGKRHLRSRTVSSLTTLSNDGDIERDGSDEDAVAASTASDIPALTPMLELDPDESSSRVSRKLRPMTSLQFAAGSCSWRHGDEWLSQLESLLLDGVDLPVDPTASSAQKLTVPNHLLFHEERTLSDFQHALSSFSKHMYFESMSRLYLLHRPAVLLAFVRCIAEYSPRLFSLSGWMTAMRSHAERALTLLPPVQFFVARARQSRQEQRPLSSSARRGRARLRDTGLADGRHALLAYVRLLATCGFYLEAVRALLDADFFDECIEMFLVADTLPQRLQRAQRHASSSSATSKVNDAVSSAVYFALVEHSVQHRGAHDLVRLLQFKPPHVSTLLVLKALKHLLPHRIERADAPDSDRVTVGMLRPVLQSLLVEHRSNARTVITMK
ncbi:hypothetical protein P43SY_000061 [Pythium insidiosum]|uniref:Uncharacterized protein n=1 Tax=Pythium insidiosum TaxID=114742 RepID=A0AAD5Q7L6_PYTIN|nr:hypothetical protein P43SY_000061 [Pythium insidiosum]